MPRAPIFRPPSSGQMTGYRVDPDGTPVITVDLGKVKPNNQARPGPIGNTQGIIVPQTSPGPGSNSAPTPQAPPGEEKGWWKRWGSAVTHGVLDVVGMIPVIGEPANLIGAGIYALEGDLVSAGMDLAAMWPAGGQGATVAKNAMKYGDTVLEQAVKNSDNVAGALVKQGDEVVQATGKNVDEAADAAKKKKGGNVDGNCKHLEKGPPGAKHKGGKHGKVQEDSARMVRESHHVPPDSISPYGKANGPALSMDYRDHRALSSTGRKTSDVASIAQAKLAKSGPGGFLIAMMAEIDEIQQKFPGKYDAGIAWMLLWAACMGYIPSPGRKK